MDEFKERLSHFSKQEIGRSVSQVAHAKELAMLELPNTANTLVRAPGSEETVTRAIRCDRASLPVLEHHSVIFFPILLRHGNSFHDFAPSAWPRSLSLFLFSSNRRLISVTNAMSFLESCSFDASSHSSIHFS